MEKIPLELFYEILDNLPLIDIFRSKRVCKKFLIWINNYYITSLTVTKTGLPLTERSFDTCQKVNYLNLIRKNDLFRDQFETNRMLMNLKRLFVYEYKIDSCYFLKKVNCLKNLEFLEILKVRLTSNCLLNLPKLKKLNFYLTLQQTNYGLIHLETPQLKELKFNSIKFAKICYPDKLISVKVLKYHSQLKELINLRSLSISNLNKNEIEDDFLMNLNKLDEFHFEGDSIIFKLLKKQMEIYGRSFKIYHFGVCYSNKPRNLIINYDHILTERRIQFYNNRLIKLSNYLPIINCVEYNERLFDKLSVDFIQKLTGIKLIKIYDFVLDESKLIQFIQNCGNVIRMHLIFSNFSSQFYSKLAHLTPFLCELNFNHFGYNLKFDFLTKLKFLKHIITINHLDLIDLKMILTNLKLLKNLEFRYEIKSPNKEVEKVFDLKLIRPTNKLVYRLIVSKTYSFDFNAQEDLIWFLDKKLDKKKFNKKKLDKSIQKIVF